MASISCWKGPGHRGRYPARPRCILTTDVTLLRNGGDLLLSIDQSPTQLLITSFASVEQILFDGGTIWDAGAIVSHTFVGAINSMTGTAGNDTFVVGQYQDTVTEAVNQGIDTD